MLRALRAGLVLSALAGAGLAVPATAAETVYEVHMVPTRDGETIRVEIVRDPDDLDAPVILTYSPYNTIREPQPAADAVADRYVPRGYARAVADVLGTRGSTGCWDYGGAKEQRSGADVVRWLSERPWSNGRIGMTGASYEGTTATMVAALGEEVSAGPDGGKGLAGIVPIAAISRWYGYAYSDGVRYFLNSRRPTDEGFDTPLAFDLGFGRTVPVDPQRDPQAFGAALAERTGECGTAEHTERGYDRSPDYDAFWLERDYRKDAADVRVPALVVHGWQDYNVKQEEAVSLYEALPVDPSGEHGVPFKKLWMTQLAHTNATGPEYQALVDAFWDRTLKLVDNGVEDRPAVTSFTKTATSTASTAVKLQGDDLRPKGSQDLVLHLGRSFDTVPGLPPAGVATSTGEGGTLTLAKPESGAGWTHADAAGVSEEASLADPTNRRRDAAGQPVRSHGYAWLYHESAPLERDLRVAGSALLRTTVTSRAAGQHLTPLLVEVLPTGALHLVQRGFLNLDYRDGLGTAKPQAGELEATVRFLPQDHVFTKGNRIGVLLQGSNTVWAVPGAAGTLAYDMTRAKGTSLVLPVAGSADGVLPG